LGKRKLCARFFATLLDTWAKGRSNYILPRHGDGRCRQNLFLTKLLREMRTGVLPMTPKQSDRVWMGWWDIPSAEETEIPKVPHQNHVDNFFRLSRRSAQRIRTRGKNSKCRILYSGLPPEAHSAGSSSCVLLSRFFLVAR
jgi:hypothetical protein